VVHVPSPVRFDRHGKQHADLIAWLGAYRVHTPGVSVGDNSTIRLDMENEPQPDALMVVDLSHGGTACVSADGYLESPPELAAEVASSTVSIDLTAKFAMYLRHGVREYLVWRVLDCEVDWFILRGNRYDRIPLHPDGIFRSEVFPGLWLDPAALVSKHLTRVHQVLQQGLASPEHADFVARLTQGARQRS